MSRLRCLRPSALLAASLLALPAAAVEPGAELRLYPSGLIASGTLRVPLDARSEFGVSAGYNFVRRDDAGEHQDERGGGLGAGLSYHRYPWSEGRGWFYGARAELFLLNIAWSDPGRRGDSDSTVLQPTAEIGYRLPPYRGLSLRLTAAAGAEINVSTSGEQVGEGAIGLIGLSAGF